MYNAPGACMKYAPGACMKYAPGACFDCTMLQSIRTMLVEQCAFIT